MYTHSHTRNTTETINDTECPSQWISDFFAKKFGRPKNATFGEYLFFLFFFFFLFSCSCVHVFGHAVALPNRKNKGNAINRSNKLQKNFTWICDVVVHDDVQSVCVRTSMCVPSPLLCERRAVAESIPYSRLDIFWMPLCVIIVMSAVISIRNASFFFYRNQPSIRYRCVRRRQWQTLQKTEATHTSVKSDDEDDRDGTRRRCGRRNVLSRAWESNDIPRNWNRKDFYLRWCVNKVAHNSRCEAWRVRTVYYSTVPCVRWNRNDSKYNINRDMPKEIDLVQYLSTNRKWKFIEKIHATLILPIG